MCLLGVGLFSNRSGLHGYLEELAVVESRFDIVYCYKTKANRLRHAAELRFPRYSAFVLSPPRGSRHDGIL